MAKRASVFTTGSHSGSSNKPEPEGNGMSQPTIEDHVQQYQQKLDELRLGMQRGTPLSQIQATEGELRAIQKRPPDRLVKHYAASTTFTQQKQESTKGGVGEGIIGTETGCQLSSNNNNSWKGR